MTKIILGVALVVCCIQLNGCVTYAVVEKAGGQQIPDRPLLEDIQPLSASSDGKHIHVCFQVRGGGNEAIYTAVAPDPDGPYKADLPSVGPFEVRSLKHGCHLNGQIIEVHPDPVEHLPGSDSARGVYSSIVQDSLRQPSYRFIYWSGKNTDAAISIFEAEQFQKRVNATPALYLAVPFTLVADIVVTPLFLLWMSVCGSCK